MIYIVKLSPPKLHFEFLVTRFSPASKSRSISRRDFNWKQFNYFLKKDLKSHVKILNINSKFIEFDHLRVVVVNYRGPPRDLVGHVGREELDEVVGVSLDQNNYHPGPGEERANLVVIVVEKQPQDSPQITKEISLNKVGNPLVADKFV